MVSKAVPSYPMRALARIASLALLCGGCGTPEQPPTEPPEPPPNAEAPIEFASVEAAWTMSLPELRGATESAGARPDRALLAAELARVLSIRAGDDEPIERARAWLTAAGRDRASDGACEASLALARLEARDASRPRDAYAVAFRTSLRFASTDGACARSAAAMLPTLEPWRPARPLLAAIRADPDAEPDPSRVHDPFSRWAAEQAGQDAARLESIRLHGSEELDDASSRASSVRVVLTFDHAVAYEHGEAAANPERPRRTWLQLAAATLGEGVPAELPVGAGGLRRLVVQEQRGGVRVVFELDELARFHAFVLPDPFRIVLDVELGGVRAEGPVEVVVLDPGHGGDDFGARAFGLRESDLTLDIMRRVRALLRQRMPDLRVVSTREEDVLVSLEARAALANAVDADLFLSIHLNAADEPIGRGGVTTFVLDTSDDRQALRLAARENRTSVARVSSLSRLIASMHREGQVAASRAFADHLHPSTLAAGRRHLPDLYDRGVRSALFYVLVGARMPAVLLEASFLSREDEAEALRTEAYRQALAEGITEGIVGWAGR